jgi:ABC-2 type transport system permease protein
VEAMRSLFRRYFAYAKLGLVGEYRGRASLFASLIFFTLLIAVFQQLWTTAIGGVRSVEISAEMLVWYIAIAECVYFAAPHIHLEIEYEIKSGAVGYEIVRPVDYVTARIAQTAGAALFRTIVMLVATFASATLITGVSGIESQHWASVVLIVYLAAFAIGVSVNVVTLSAFWMDPDPLRWVWQKLIFLFGGLLVPLSFYPAWFADIARPTPWAAMLNGPAWFAIHSDSGAGIGAALHLLIWTLVFIALFFWVFSRGRRRLVLAGG